MKILVGPRTPMVGSHLDVSRIEGAVEFEDDLLAAVDRVRPDVVLLRAAGHGAVPVADVARCPVPVVGLLHDWVAWGSERLEAVARTVDWLITEKSAYRYLRAAGVEQVSTFLLMSRSGVERVAAGPPVLDATKRFGACFLGSFYLGGTDNPLRREPPDARGRHHEAMMARLGFRERSPYVAAVTSSAHPTFVAASTGHLQRGPDHNPSFDIVAQSHLNVHVDGGRMHAANRCFESLALGTPLLCERDNELFDYLPEGLAIPYALDELEHTLDDWLGRPGQLAELGAESAAFAKRTFDNATLRQGLREHIETRWPAIRARFESRRIDLADQRAPVHWEGKRLYHRAVVTPHLERQRRTPSGDNELGCYAFEASFVEGEVGALARAVTCFEAAVAGAPHQAGYRWNLAVARRAAGDQAGCARELRALLELATAPPRDFAWSGSRLEVHTGAWISGHVEHHLALAKLRAAPSAWPELEARAFSHRAAMLLGLQGGPIYLPELPDEHLVRGDLATACALDPLLRPSAALCDAVEDLRRRPAA